MKQVLLIIAITATTLLASCTTATDLPGVDAALFKGDKNGCNGYRAGAKAVLEANLSQLKRLSEPEIVATLGPADRKDLSARSQKYFKYYLSGAQGCPSKTDGGGRPTVLLVRFNSLNRVTETSIGLDN